MLTVNITGSATGTAPSSSTSISGRMSSSGTPLTSENARATASSAPTIDEQPRDHLADHLFDVQLGPGHLHQLRRPAKVGAARRSAMTTPVASPRRTTEPAVEHVAAALVHLEALAGQGRLVDRQLAIGDADVGGHEVPGAQPDDVAGHQLASRQGLPGAVAQHARLDLQPRRSASTTPEARLLLGIAEDGIDHEQAPR